MSSDDPTDQDETTEADGAEESRPDGAAKNPADIIREAIEKASHSFLKDRFALNEDADGRLSIPHPERYGDLGAKAESFVQGFFKGFIRPTDEDGEVIARDAEDFPKADDIFVGLLAKMSNALSTSFRSYVGDHAEEAPRDDEGKVVVDGSYVMKHGAPLIGTLIGALGDAFAPKPATGGDEPAEPDSGETGSPGVDVRFDFSNIFKQILTPQGSRTTTPEEE